MKQRTMWLIITIMALSMIGIGVIQFVWFKSSVEQDKKNFDDKIKIAMGLVKDKLWQDAQKEDIMMKKWKQFQKDRNSKSTLLNDIKIFNNILKKSKTRKQRQNYNFEITGAEMLVDPNSFLENIHKEKLDTYLKYEMEQQDIGIEYDYGVYSNKEESFIIMNGNYTASIGNTNQSTNIEVGNDLYNSEYKLSLFDTALSTGDEGVSTIASPGYLQIYFPEKSRALWSSVIPSLLTSILLTGLVLFCFGYVMYVIQRQKQVSEMKTDFINNMTHEFKTPIATISLASDSIGSPMILNNPDKVMRFTNIIKQENQRMLSQVEKVLQMAMLDKKDFELKLSEVDMHTVIGNAAGPVGLKVAKRDGNLHTHLTARKSVIKADVTHISNIIHNLLDNAEKYSPEQVDISISTENYKNGLVITIVDKGIGMSKEQVKNIFEKFYRAHTGNIHDVKGFGLGLSYVKAIVDAHGGSVKVKSEQGIGSQFQVFLPFDPAS